MLVVRADELEFGELPGRRTADPLAAVDAPPVSVRIVRIDPGPRTPHHHPHSVEIICVLAGSGHHRQGSEERRVGRGDVVLVPAGVPHCTTAEPGSALELVCFFPHPDLKQNIVEGDPVRHKFLIHRRGDHVGVAVAPISAGETVLGVFMDDDSTIEVVARADVPLGHKIAVRATDGDPAVLEYGVQIGNASVPLEPGDYVHTHNLKSARW
jgi:(2R)-sulfolactate sulfo-lyase subunit alpha